jgi:hypothetical protein
MNRQSAAILDRTLIGRTLSRTLTLLLGWLMLVMLGFASSLSAQAQELQCGGWQALGPFDNEGGNKPGEHALHGFLEDMTIGKEWPALAESFSGRASSLEWKAVTGRDPHGTTAVDSGYMDFASLLGAKNVNNQTAFLYCALDAPSAMEVDVFLGSDDGCEVWLNGKSVLRRTIARAVNPYEEQLRLSLQEGRNHFLVQVASANGGWGFVMQAQRDIGQDAINRAVDRGIDYLLGQQLIDGSWQQHQEQYRNGGTALAVFTLLSSGIDPSHPAIQRGLAYLKVAPSEDTYSISCELMALAAMDDESLLPWIEERADDLISWQFHNGGWAYPEGHWDFSTTQFAALGLRAAAKAGAEIPEEVWKDMINLCLDNQARPNNKRLPLRAGFDYYPGYNVPTGSMTAAGISVMAIAREQLGENMKRTVAPKVEEAIQLSLQFLKEDFTTAVNPHFQLNWRYYWLYGIERVGALLNLEQLGHHDWYQSGAAFLVADQGGNGQWATIWGRPEATTCFALLFLKKATARAVATGQSAQRKDHLESELGKHPVVLHVNPRPPATMWVVPPKGVKPTAVRYEIRRPGAATWIEVGMGVGDRFALQHEIESPGVWEVRAEVFGPQEGSPTPASLGYSAVISGTFATGLREGDLLAASAAERNLLPASRPTILISSQVGSYGSDKMIDGMVWSAWECAQNDTTPTIEIKCKRKPKVRRLLLTQARNSAGAQAVNPRPATVELWINKEKTPVILQLEPDATQKTVYEFPKRTKISTLKIVITAVTDGTLGAGAFGFAEIALED